jgi:hypothetical protein
MDGLVRRSRFGQKRTKPDSHPFFMKFLLYFPHYFRNDGRRRCKRPLMHRSIGRGAFMPYSLAAKKSGNNFRQLKTRIVFLT